MGAKEVLSPADFAELMEDSWSPEFRAMLETGQERAARLEVEREEQRAKETAALLARRRTTDRLSACLRALRAYFCDHFEMTAWQARTPPPGWLLLRAGRIDRDRAGLDVRLRRIRSEAAAGCELQQDWLDQHAEMLEAAGLAGLEVTRPTLQRGEADVQ